MSERSALKSSGPDAGPSPSDARHDDHGAQARRVGGGRASPLLNWGRRRRRLAPDADARNCPVSFLSPMQDNEPGLTSALGVLARLVERLTAQQIPPERIALLGFSQGACLSLEFAARHPQRYKAVVGLSGGLIGPPGTPRDYPGSFDGAPVFLGCSDVDAHIPLARVQESADVFRRMGAAVDERIYPGMGHTVNEDEIAAIQSLLA